MAAHRHASRKRQGFGNAARHDIVAGALLIICCCGAKAFATRPVRADSIQTTAQYLAALHAADSSAFAREFEIDFRLLLESQQLRAYDSLATTAERKSFVELYWRAVNPAPLLAENDRLADHLRRRLYVRKHFAQRKPPYFDDRGTYYLKYGKPSVRYEDPGGIRRVAFFNLANYELLRRMYSLKGQPEQYYNVIANETWAYENVARDFVVHFMKEGASFREITDLSEIIVNHQRKDQSWQLSDLIKQRAAVSPVLGRTSMEIEQFEVAMLHAIGLQRRGELILSEIQAPAERIFEIARANEYEAEKARAEVPASAHEPIKAVNRVAFTESIAQFRGPNGYNRIEIDLFAPFKNNFVAKLDTANTDTLFLEFAWLLRDVQLEEIGGQRTRREIPLKLAARENLPRAAGRLTFLALPQPMELFLQMKDRVNGHLGFSRRAFELRDFNGKEPALSDLQFYAEVKNESQSAVLPIVDKQNFALTPYPYPKIRKRIPLFCYFEIYHLRSAGITGDYEINYRVISDLTQESLFKKFSRLLTGAKESAVSMSRAQAATDDSAQELIALDLGNLTRGVYRLEVTVTSVANPKLKASVVREIEVED